MPIQQSTLICLYTVLFCSPIDVYMGSMAINMYFYLIMGTFCLENTVTLELTSSPVFCSYMLTPTHPASYCYLLHSYAGLTFH